MSNGLEISISIIRAHSTNPSFKSTIIVSPLNHVSFVLVRFPSYTSVDSFVSAVKVDAQKRRYLWLSFIVRPSAASKPDKLETLMMYLGYSNAITQHQQHLHQQHQLLLAFIRFSHRTRQFQVANGCNSWMVIRPGSSQFP